MKNLRNSLVALAALSLISIGASPARAEDSKAEGPPAASAKSEAGTAASGKSEVPNAANGKVEVTPVSPGDVSNRLQELQDEMDRIHGEMINLKKQLGVGTSVAATPAASNTQAAQTESTPAAQQQPPAPPAPAGPAGPTYVPFTAVSGIYTSSGDPDLGKNTGIKLFEGIKYRAWIDAYYEYNFNNPEAASVNALQSTTAIKAANATIQGRTFDVHSNSFTLSLAEIELEKIPDKGGVGFKFDMAFGDTQNIYNDTIIAATGANSLSQFDKTFQQASISYLAPIGKGLRLDFGKFVTHIGGETIESIKNANFSHSFFYTYGIPFQDTGLRVHYDFNDKLYTEAYVLNGWNVGFDINRGKTYGYTVSYTVPKYAIVANWLGGPEQPNNSSNWRNLGDFQFYYNPTAKFRTMTNIDVAHEGQAIATGIREHPHANATWDGVAEVLRYRATTNFDPSFRFEWYRDPQGFTTGVPCNMLGFTATFDYFLGSGPIGKILVRPEFRYDHMTAPFFTTEGVPGLTKKYQPTVGVDFVYYID